VAQEVELKRKLGGRGDDVRGRQSDDAPGKITKAGPVPLRADMNVAEAFAVIARSCIRHFRLNEPIVIQKRDPEALHQTRVAMRRLRAAVSLFRPALKDRRFEPLRKELRWFTSICNKSAFPKRFGKR
jgi:triphosphatase